MARSRHAKPLLNLTRDEMGKKIMEGIREKSDDHSGFDWRLPREGS